MVRLYTTKYYNVRCRKCNNILSLYLEDDKDRHPINKTSGWLLTKKYHDCPQGINDDEKIIADLISVSKEHPVGEVVTIGSEVPK